MRAALACLAAALLGTAAAQDAPVRTAAPVQGSYWDERQRGWHFYEAPVVGDAPQPVVPSPAADVNPPEIRAFEQLQKSLEQARQVAIMVPTEDNVRHYMVLEARVVAQASRFADVAQRVAWATPALDPTVQGRPVNAKALDVFEQDRQQARARTVRALATDHVLFFFFRSDCPYCHAFAPTLAAFEARYALRIVPVSLDGGGITGFDTPRRDNGIAQTLQVTQVPALFLAAPFEGRVAPVGFGVLSESQLLERITQAATQAATQASNAPAASPPPTLR
jgi:conjugal transfer pilus assembly protein TraF